jgi:hypothetical protein
MERPHSYLVDMWLRANPSYRIAHEKDCGDCAEDINGVRKGNGGPWKPKPQYDPYYTVGDFNGDGRDDFAIALVNIQEADRQFVVLIFNGPFSTSSGRSPSFISSPLDLKGAGMFFGPPRPRPYRLVIGGFGSEGCLVVPVRSSYTSDCPDLLRH